MKLGKELSTLSKAEPILVDREITILIHVVDIGPEVWLALFPSSFKRNTRDSPDILKRNPEFAEAIHYILQFRPVRIPPSTLMVSESEVLLHCRKTSSAVLVCLGNLVLSWASIKVEVDASTQSSPSDV